MKHVSSSSRRAVERAVSIAGGQTKLASLIGCAQQRISDIITGRRPLSAEIAVRISDATGVPRHELRPDIFSEAA